jgi:hypothetical protein
MLSLQKFNNYINKCVMCTVLVSYDEKNKVVSQFMRALSMMKDVKVDDDVWLTEDEIKRIEKAKASGTCKDIDGLLNYLKSKI